MPLLSGARLGVFEVLERIGAGGMGEVYRARDTRLDRIVAVKVISASELPGRDRIERFKREARASSRLSHPHICALYDIGEHDGEAFLVMEYVAGETLAERLERGPLRIEEVLRYGVQIADALDIAHRNGVVHRDLKPSNIMLSRDGVKLLDFGLAKLRDVDADRMGNAPTMSLGLSEEGLILGSLPYMAPEQLEGRPVDARADLFALGAVLYEMTTGEPPFRGSSKASLIVAILSEEPAPPMTRQPLTPALFDRTIRRCLAKQPDERWQTAADLAAELKYILETPQEARPSAVQVLRPRRALWVTALGLALVGLTIWVIWQMHSSESALIVSSQRPVGTFGASYRQATISPDGGLIAFADAGKPVTQIWIKNLAQGDPLQVTSGETQASHPTWSPNNDQIVFARRGQGLWSVPPLGGNARRLLEFGENPQFSADGERLVFERRGHEIWTARADGSEAKRVGGVPVPWYPGGLNPAFSPDASSIVYFMPEVGPNGDFWIVPTTGGTPRQLTHDFTEGGGAIWTPDGRFIVFSSMRGGSRTLWRVRAGGGTPEPLTAGVGEDLEPTLSRDGRTLLYTNVRNQYQLRALHPDTGEERVILERRRQTIFPRVSPDGSMVAFFGFGDVGDTQIFVTPVNGGALQQLTHGKGYVNTMPRWSPDGSSIYYYEQRPGSSFRSIPAGGGASREVRRWKWESYTDAEFSRDESLIVYFRQAAPGEDHVVEQTMIEDAKSGKQRPIGLPLIGARWSPDGQSLLGQTTPAPFAVAICPVDGTSCRLLAPGRMPVWSADASRIYFLRDTAAPPLKELWTMTPDGGDQRRVFDRMGPYRAIDVRFDVSRKGEIIWGGYIEGRHELWQATLRP
jgi:eukaryotic-like serine/threonine-protein kinase